VSAQSANGLVDYSLDDESYQADSLFSGLMSGLHFVSARDVLGCEAVANVMIDSTPIISFINIDVTEPECFSNSGIIDIDLGGGTGELNYFIDGEVLNNLQITNLAPANYEILVTDSLGCASSAAVEVPIPLCPIYFPNIITPHLSNPNNLFIASTHELYDVGIIEYSIFDRWGEKIFVSRDFSIHTRGSVWWDGRINGKMAEQDVYAYRVEVVHPNGQVEVFIDTVFLLR